LNPIDGARLFFHQLRSVSHQAPQIALRTRGNEAALQQSTLQQLRGPLAVPNVALGLPVAIQAAI